MPEKPITIGVSSIGQKLYKYYKYYKYYNIWLKRLALQPPLSHIKKLENKRKSPAAVFKKGEVAGDNR